MENRNQLKKKNWVGLDKNYTRQMVFLGEKIIAVKKKQSRNLEVLVETLCIFVSKLEGWY